VTRGFLESIGQWKFPDERPLRYEEVLAAIGEWGEVIFQKTLWPLLLTQGMIVAKRKSAFEEAAPEIAKAATEL
ncbi:MAG TPA: hypothetical protein VMB85_27255, partial [Bryobacteraceae bacterium]|nr:hypothetical protein [Bryobacteraceae bacterium]